MNNDSVWTYIQHFFITYGHMFFYGTLTTLWILAISLIIGLCFAIPLGMILASKKSWIIRFPAIFFSYIFRGTPMLIQLYIIYYALGIWLSQFSNLPIFIQHLIRNKEFWGILCFSLNTAAYTSEIIRGAIETAPHGEIEAARALGMNQWQINRRILFPGALRRALPAYSNEVVFMLHGSAIISTIAVTDIMQASRIAYGKSYEPYLPFISAGIIYLLITIIIFFFFRMWERYLYRHILPVA